MRSRGTRRRSTRHGRRAILRATWRRTVARPTTRSSGRVGYAVRAARAIADQPYEGAERTLERLAERLDRRRPPWPYQVTEPCEERVHDLLGAPWPCEEQEGFQRVWDAVTADL